MNNLFECSVEKKVPLAERLRPQSLDDVLGQEHLLGEGGPLRQMLSTQRLSSLILWGPPGCGKTTIARLLASYVDMAFVTISAVLSGVSDLRKIFQTAEDLHKMGKQTLLFVDEIHRFNRSQQDSFLSHVEKGVVVLIGATTENPSFELNSALLSRTQVLTIHRLTHKTLNDFIENAENYFGQPFHLTTESRELLCDFADGDGRAMFNMLEMLHDAVDAKQEITPEYIKNILQRRAALYDKSQDGHYNLISALHKSLRGSDVNAALYWFSRMLVGGEDPLYVARRLVRFASEDVGMADPQALIQAMAAVEAYKLLGSPEGELSIVQALIYLATAPKSNALYTAYNASLQSAQKSGSLMPPKHILNAPTKLMSHLDYGKGYQYDHDTPAGFSGQNYFPEGMSPMDFYHPVERGFEREILKRLQYWERLRNQKKGQ
jgi:putative ATPase